MRQFDFMGTARIWFGISLVVMLIGVVSLTSGFWSNRPGLNLGIDFTGGLLVDGTFAQDHGTADVRAVVRESIGTDPTVQKMLEEDLQMSDGTPAGSRFSIRLPDIAQADQDRLFADLQEKLSKFDIQSVDKVSPSIRQELITDALIALAIAAILQMGYMWWRFELRFAITAIAAVIHDTVITLGLVSLLRMEVGPAFIAAILTVIGYSVNDTIIIFDRIREHLRRSKRVSDPSALVNVSINETLSRTLKTVATTLLAILAIIILGGQSTRDFALTMFIGIISGTYSSIFIASPLWVWWLKWDSGRRTRRRTQSA